MRDVKIPFEALGARKDNDGSFDPVKIWSNHQWQPKT